VRTIGLIGAGRIGSQVARLAVAHGYSVVTPGYGPRRNAAELRRDLAAAKRYRDL
jgi:phosphoglycerate dehydrogenase-like enzyme